MKTYSPVADLADIDWWVGKMEADPDGEWVFLEDHLAVVAENALKIKARDVEIERLKSFVNQLIDLGLMQSDDNHFSPLDREI